MQSFIKLACSQNFTTAYDPSTGQTTAMQLQWNTSGIDISNANIGNVGIGTVSPSNKLSVSGNADISGNMGIGTVSPSNKLSVSGNADISGNLGIGTPFPSNRLSVSGNADISGAVSIGLFSNGGSIVPFWVSTSSQTNWKGGGAFGSFTANVIMGELAGVASIGGHNSTLTAWANLAINPGGGNVGIGTTAPTATLSVNGSANKPGGGSWAVFSDARLKQNVQPYNDGLSALLKIKPVTYHYNELSGCDTKPQYVGVIAQDLKDVAPYMVSDFTRGGASYLQVDNSAMTYMLINAVKEQQAQIEVQKAETEKLKADYEARLKALEEKLNKLMGNESANK